jgi:Ca2+-binding RTX toxin-like protein
MADVSVTTVDPNGATVSYATPAASDIVDVAPVVSCDPVSASPFPVGVTTVTCSATDASGNVVSITFEVEVVLECTIIGTSGDDLLFGTDSDDVICGLGGNDILFGRRGDDRLIGGEGNDILFGSFGDDRLIGGEGDDLLFGNDGDDYLEGGPGFDFLLGGPGTDILVQ